MNNPKFTPGPWGIEQTRTTNWIGQLRADGKCDTIVTLTDREGLKPEVVEINDANARLIASAPELYEAAKQAQNTLQRLATITDETRMGWALRALGAALAKAEGRPQ